VGLDIHRVFAEAVMLDDGKVVRLGRVGMTRDHLEAFARTLTHDDHVVVEATGNAAAVVEVIAPHVGRVVIANPRQVRLIAHAKIKTDTIDATVLAKLYASNFLPEVWMPDARTQALRRQVTRRNQIVRPAGAAQDHHPVDPACSSDAAVSACRAVRHPGTCLAHGPTPTAR
jgi:transposase